IVCVNEEDGISGDEEYVGLGDEYNRKISSCRGVGVMCFFFFQAEDGIRDVERSRGLGDVYKRTILFVEDKEC
ncbi:hypothetical protein, partial [Clostridium butyricum]